MDCQKRDYLVKTLSRTNRKDYENYAINAIYQKLNNFDIKPITQHCIRSKTGKYYLVDLYFPQLNYAIEIDEKYHQSNIVNDIKRESEILDSTNESKDFVLRRIDVDQNIEDINEKISEIVIELNERIEKKQELEVWDIEKKPAKIIFERHKLDINDSVRFSTILETTDCFNKNYEGYQQSTFEIDKNYIGWCPQLSIEIDGKVASTKNGWKNYLSSDWAFIYEENTQSAKRKMKDEGKRRITFMKLKDSLGKINYKFIGVYECVEMNEFKRTYARVEQTIYFKDSVFIPKIK